MSVFKATKSIIYHVQRKRGVSKKYPLYVPFSAGTVCRTSPNSSKCKNSTEPQAMSPGDV